MRALALLLSVATFAATVSAARADEPTADEILARSRAATGTERRPDAEREFWSLRVGGLEGTLALARRGVDTIATTDLGPFRTEHGVSHAQRWHQNENGETILDRTEPSQAEHILTQTVARVRAPLDAWEIATTYASGHLLRAYYDPRTYFLERTERVVAGRTTHTVYDDFRVDPRGRARAWHYYGGDEHPENDYDYRLLRDEPAADISEADLAIPRDRRILVEFPTTSEPVRLPARIENGRIYVRVQIAGRGLDFLLDTGAAALSISESVARTLGLPVYGRAAQTVAGTFETSRVVVPAMSVGGLTMHDVVMHTVPLALQESRDTRVVGLLGFDFLSGVALKIDYAGGTVDALRPTAFVPPAAASPVEVRLNSGAPVAHAIFGNAAGEDFILDTGAAFSYVIFQRFARAHPDAVAPLDEGRLEYGSGVGGTLSFRHVSAKRLTVGSATFEDALGVEALSPYALGFDNEDGLIGAAILKQFTLYLDYQAGRLYLSPPGRPGAPQATGLVRR